MRTAN
ncbi:hypothetical protein IEO21_09727 [Rhodonia placenta]